MEKKDKLSAKIDRVELRFHLLNYSHIGAHLINTMDAYKWMHNGFESLTQKHEMPAIRSLEAIKGMEVVFQEIKDCIEQIKKVT